jgi:hypothetical protein
MTDIILAAEAPRETKGRPKGTTDKAPRKPPKFKPEGVVREAVRAGYKVRMTIDSDGKITLEMGQAGDSPDGEKGERNEWDALGDE